MGGAILTDGGAHHEALTRHFDAVQFDAVQFDEVHFRFCAASPVKAAPSLPECAIDAL